MKDYFRQYYPALESLRSQVNSLVEDFVAGVSNRQSGVTGCEMMHMRPKAKIVETDTNIEVLVELPGVDEGKLEVTAGPTWVRVRGEKPEASQENTVHMSEIRYGKFEREYALPCAIDEKEVSATLKNGLLTVRLKKAVQVRQGVSIPVTGE